MAVDFVSERYPDWSPDRLSDQARTDLLSALEARWATHVAYARLQQTIFDLVWDCSQALDLQQGSGSGGPPETEQSAILRQITLLDGRFAENRDRILNILAWLAESRNALGLFCRDFLEVRETKRGEVTLKCTNLRRTERLTCDEIRTRAAEYCSYLTDAVETLRQVRQDLVEH